MHPWPQPRDCIYRLQEASRFVGDALDGMFDLLADMLEGVADMLEGVADMLERVAERFVGAPVSEKALEGDLAVRDALEDSVVGTVGTL